jgi:molecular chaperone GrpE
MNDGEDRTGAGPAPSGPSGGDIAACGAAPAGDAAAEAGDEASSAEAAEMAALRQELDAQTRLAADYLDGLQRLKADFDNYRRRMMGEQARWRDMAVAEFIGGVLPVVDDLERAVAAGGDAEAVRQGVAMTLRQFHQVLLRAGVEPMEPVGRPFDPTVCEAVEQVPSGEHPDGTVMAEMRRGYLFKKQVLRPALVRVAKALESRSAAGATGDGERASD